MSLSSWPPTGWKPPTQPSSHQGTPGETTDEVFAALLREYIKRLPSMYTKRQNELRRWVQRYNRAKQR